MKKTRNLVALLLCALLAAMAVLPAAFASAENPAPHEYLSETDVERLRTFFNQTNEAGVTNGELMAEELQKISGFEPTSYNPDSIESFDALYNSRYFGFCGMESRFSLSFCGVPKSPCEGALSGIFPILSGPLDLSGTSIGMLENSLGRRCNIPAIYLNDCSKLIGISYINNGLKELHALNTNLIGVEIESDSLCLLEVQLEPADEPVIIDVLGSGSFTFQYNSTIGITQASNSSECPMIWETYSIDHGIETYSAPKKYTVEATGDTSRFLGWYSGGDLFCAKEKYNGYAEAGIRLTAVFAGDANGDGVVDMSDALSIMRSGMGLDAQGEIGMCDIDGDTQITTSDSLVLMRFVLGLN